MRALLLLLLILGGCMSAMKETGAAADELKLGGAWIGLDDTGAHWWRLQLDEGRRGRGGFETNGKVARYDVTSWAGDAQGGVQVDLVRNKEATALDRAPATIRLTGRSDGVRLRLRFGESEIVFLREDELLAARTRLHKRMTAE